MLPSDPVVASTVALAEEWRLYTKATAEQWNAETDLDWSTEIILPPGRPAAMGREMRARMLSQFYYGEQGAFLLCSQLVDRLPDLEGRLYLATQVVDEARHVEAFGRYLTKLGTYTPMNPWLRELLDRLLVCDSVIEEIVGMQIMVEGLALDVFADMRQQTPCPLLRELLYRVKTDEARHVAFGLTYLPRLLGRASRAERRHAETQLVEYARLLLMVVGGPSPFAGFIFQGLQERLRHLDLTLPLP